MPFDTILERGTELLALLGLAAAEQRERRHRAKTERRERT